MGNRKEIVVWGAGGHAMVVADIIRQSQLFEIVGFLDDVNPHRHRSAFCESVILGGREQLDFLRKQGVRFAIIAFGNCEARLKLSNYVRQSGFLLATAIHPSSVVAADVKLGPGTVVAAGAVVNPACTIGDSVIINTAASVDHECVIEDGVHICPGVRLGGKVHIGQATWVGIGAAVSDRIRIGARTLIGVGAAVVSDIPDGVVAYGVPARIVKQNDLSDASEVLA